MEVAAVVAPLIVLALTVWLAERLIITKAPTTINSSRLPATRPRRISLRLERLLSFGVAVRSFDKLDGILGWGNLTDLRINLRMICSLLAAKGIKQKSDLNIAYLLYQNTLVSS